jgi:hypothetical protein
MKKLIIALLLAAFSVGGVYGQSEDEARDLFRAKTRPGAKIRIELLRNGRREFVPLDTVFRSGDKIKLHFEVNFPAYVEIHNLGTSGARERLFPYPGAASRVKVTSGYVVPYQATQWFEFDDRPGVERLTFTFSSTQLIAANNQPPSKKPSAGAAPVRPGGQATASETQQALDEFDSRDLNRVQVKEDHYVFCNEQRLRRAVKVAINLQHR